MANKIGPSIASIDIDKPGMDTAKSSKLLQKMLDAYEKRKTASKTDRDANAE